MACERDEERKIDADERGVVGVDDRDLVVFDREIVDSDGAFAENGDVDNS